MKNRIILLFLAALMLLSLAACNNSSVEIPEVTDEPPEVTAEPTLPSYEAQVPLMVGGVYQITEPSHMIYMAQNPDKKYALADDIDMYGYVWTPIDDFSGELSGQIYKEFNYTISNMVVEVKEGDTNAGIFRTVSGKVADINFHDITVTCSGTFTGNLGVVAGVAKTALDDVEVKTSSIEATVKDANVGLLCGKSEKDVSTCDVAGELNVKLSGGTSYVGGGIGYAQGTMMSCEIRTDVTVDGTGTSGATGGLLGYTSGVVRVSNYIGHITVNADATYNAGKLVGNMAGAGMVSCYDCTRSFNVTGAVAAANDFCGAVAGNPTFNGCLIRDNSNIEDTLSKEERALREKVVAYGYKMATTRWTPSQTIVYQDNCTGSNGHAQTYEAGTYYFGQPYTHQCASLAKFLDSMDENHVILESIGTDSDALRKFGNDCAELVYWSWSQVEAEIAYTQTSNAICTGGVLPVGNFQVTDITDTAKICKDNGKQVMYEAYAKLQMGDGLLDGPGHFRLVAEAAYVFRKADGSIDPDKSYIVTHEQGIGTLNLATNHTTCKANGKYTFSKLFGTDYIPVTVEALNKGVADELVATTTNTKLDKSGVAAGTLTTNYCPDTINVRITNSRGRVMADLIAHPTNAYILKTFELSTFMPDIEAAGLTEGREYTYEVYVESAGQKVLVQSFKFTR